jgi:hypothetical protein
MSMAVFAVRDALCDPALKLDRCGGRFGSIGFIHLGQDNGTIAAVVQGFDQLCFRRDGVLEFGRSR